MSKVNEYCPLLTFIKKIEYHFAELGNQPPKEPFFFIKPTTSYLANGGTVELPRGTEVHHEGDFGFRSTAFAMSLNIGSSRAWSNYWLASA